MKPTRSLLVIADDFGMGPETTRGILELGLRGVVTGTVLLVNSPHAESAAAAWRGAGEPMDLGWHPNLTLDGPCAPVSEVPSLVDREGRFWPLAVLVRKVLMGTVPSGEVEKEFRAQYRRFLEIVGRPPDLVNTHQHVGIFGAVGKVLISILRDQGQAPYVRRVREPWSLIWKIPGARKKRILLNYLGRKLSRIQDGEGIPGNHWLAGVTDPAWVRKKDYFRNWLGAIPGEVVELMCHPGYYDASLIGRDCEEDDGLLQRRVDELALLKHPSFLDAVQDTGFLLRRPSAWNRRPTRSFQAA